MINLMYPQNMLQLKNLFEDDFMNRRNIKKVASLINDSLWLHVIYTILVILAGLFSNDKMVIDITVQLFKSLVIQISSIYVLKCTMSSKLSTITVLVTMSLMLKLFKFSFGTMSFILFNLNFLLILAGLSGLLWGIFVSCVLLYFCDHLKNTTICMPNTVMGFLANAGIILLIFISHRSILNHSKRTYANELSTKIGHELKTPLFGIIGGLTSLDTTNLSENNKKLLSIIDACSNSILNHIDNLNEVFQSKLEGKKIEEVIDCANFIDNLIKIVTPQALQKGHRIYTHISDKCPKYIISDHIRLKHILSNLLMNAIKYTPHGGIIHFDIDIHEVDENNREIIFAIEDNGVGIEESKLDKIFESFVRLEKCPDNIFGGFGLGLSIAKSFAQDIGAKINVKSEGLNKGSTFIVSLPLVYHHEKSIEVFSSSDSDVSNDEEEGGSENNIKKRILIADDDAVNQYVLSRMIVKYNSNYKITNCFNGMEVIEKISKNPNKYSLIILDMEMPQMNGATTAKKIKEMNLDIPIIILSGHSIDKQKEMLGNTNVEMVSKPVSYNQLQTILKKFQL